MLVTFLRVHSEAFAWLGYAPRNVVQGLDAKGCHCSVCLRWGDRLGGIDVQSLAPAVRVGSFKFFVIYFDRNSAVAWVCLAGSTSGGTVASV